MATFLLLALGITLAASLDLSPPHWRMQREAFSAQASKYKTTWRLNYPRLSPPSPQTLTSPLDHFSPFKSIVFNQSYWVNTQFVNASTVPSQSTPLRIFLFVCAEETCDVGRTLGGAIFGYAREYSAAIVTLQHRFYGASQPFPDRTAEHLAGLTSVQALADWALLLTTKVFPMLNATLPGTRQVVSFGGSYGGQLAAWLRLKYPHLVHASIASSGPVFTGLDFPGYDDVVGLTLGDPINGGSPQCLGTLSQGFTAVAEGFLGGNAVARQASLDALHSCTPLTNSPLDPSFAMTSTANIFKGLVQTSGQWFNPDGIKWVCGNLSASVGKGDTPIKALGDFIKVYLSGGECQSLGYEEFNAWIRNTSLQGPDYRLWYWQTCSEQGKAQTSLVPGTASPFSSLGQTAQQYFAQCGEVFGSEVGWDAAQTLMGFSESFYGGYNVSATRVVYVNGEADPFSAGGVTASTDPLQPAVLIKGASHCADMGEPSASDSVYMAAAHKQIAQYLSQFLESPY